MEKMIITPDLRVGKMLDRYPELEDLLISISPAFKKLRNPILRKTVAKVATLTQVAKTGKIPIGILVNKLREAVGQTPEEWQETETGQEIEKPEWIIKGNLVKTVDARPMLEQGEHPLELVIAEAKKLQTGEYLQLITPFLPTPLLDKLDNKSFRHWSEQQDEETWVNYVGASLR